ncbi:MAG: DUF1624 domain-containing protein [Lachnospiraceae bacterium]|nr:DUF1624 domain-containing protein [Lachnospiraceae bacterium]
MKYKDTGKGARIALLDTIRGVTLLSMILYHACWDAVWLLGAPWDWYHGKGAFLWQQSICWTFILLSGLCVPFSRRILRRGAEVFAAGALVTAVTVIALPEERVVFGVLTLLGSCMLILGIFRRVTGDRAYPAAALITVLALSAVLFVCTRHVNAGVLGPGHPFVQALPGTLYRDYFTAWLGFPPPGFFSTDYFSMIPWAFLYLCGDMTGRLMLRKRCFDRPVFTFEIPVFSFMGRHSLLIYLLHQPVLYLGVLLAMRLRG